MSEHVVIDDSLPTCLGVHYVTTPSNAKIHFTNAGFRGIQGLTKLERNLDCNEARRRALDAAKRGEGKCFWQGQWDYSANRCAIYKFDFTSYDGPKWKAPKSSNTVAHVDWEEE